MRPASHARLALPLAALLLTATGPLSGSTKAQAQTNTSLEARYSATFTGIVVGQGSLVVEVNNEGYSTAGSAMVAGLLQTITGGKGSAASRGQFVDGRVVPLSYTGNSESKDRSQEVRFSAAGGTIREIVVQPEPRQRRDRVPVTEEHLKDAIDPMSAAVMPVAGNADVIGPAACDRTLPIFDGEQRYDLEFSFVRTEPLKDVRGFDGSTAVCRVRYRPVAGHRTGRKQVQELSENRNIFVWLAPIGDTRVVMPMRVSFESKIGTFVVQATRFTSRSKPDAVTR
jgi:hypothetical protein